MNVDVLNSYGNINEEKLDELLKEEIANNKDKIVVLDDDPTGVQTVHDVNVYTDWSYESILDGFNEENKVFYILTNSRGMTAETSERVHREIGKTVAKVSEATRKPYMIISRSDSTLRGHYPMETDVLRQEIEKEDNIIDGEILCPFFKEGGRYTIENIHYVKQGEELVPAAETEFARDVTFGYENSYIPDYIEEKTKGSFKSEDVVCITINELRDEKIEEITQKLCGVTGFGKICVDAIDYCDLKVFMIALYRAINKGKRYMYRTAAGFVKIMGGISDKPLLKRNDMVKRKTKMGGIVVVGSHTAKTTAQLSKLLTLENTVPIEFDSDKVIESDEAFWEEVKRCVEEEERIIRAGKTAVCYTRRKLIRLQDDTKDKALLRSVKISDGVQSLVGLLNTTPSFVMAKGGITSSDVGTKALKVHKARVLGQIQPGIPVWQTGDESRFPETPYVIFPGNTGDEETLKTAVQILMEK